MQRFLRWLFTGDSHNHKWKIIDQYELFSSASAKMAHGTVRVMQCEICGNIKNFRS